MIIERRTNQLFHIACLLKVPAWLFQFKIPFKFKPSRSSIIQVLEHVVDLNLRITDLSVKELIVLVLFYLFNPFYASSLLKGVAKIKKSTHKLGDLNTDLSELSQLCALKNESFAELLKHVSNYCKAFECAAFLRLLILVRYSWKHSYSDFFLKGLHGKDRCQKVHYISWLELIEIERQFCISGLQLRLNSSMPKPTLVNLGGIDSSTNLYLDPSSVSNVHMDCSYASYIDNKSIAVVGPSLKLGFYGKEIDSADLVIRLNYNGILVHGISRGGERTDISYFNGTKASCFEPFKTQCNPKMVEWVVLRDPRYAALFSSFAANVRPMRKCVNPYGAHYNLLIAVLIDILSFNARSVNIYGFDLYLSNDYPAGALSGSLLSRYPELQNRSRTYPISTITHEPTVQYLFLARLHRMGLICVDSVLLEILSGGLLLYLSKLRSAYS